MRLTTILAALVAGPVLALSAALPAQAVAPSVPDRCAQVDGRVVDIEISDGVVYVGGLFTAATDVGGARLPRSNAFAFDAATCRVLPWAPAVNGEVKALHVVGSTVYVGGLFDRVGTQRRKNLAAVGTGGALQAFAPAVKGYVGDIDSGNGRLYVAGGINSVDGQVRGKAAAFSLASGALDGQWRPSFDQQVKALDVSPDGNRVYVGGTFSTPARSLVAIDPVNGSRLAAFAPRPSVPTTDLEVTANRVVAAVAGAGGRTIVFDLTGRQLQAHQTDGNHQAVALDGDDLYSGGHFNYYCTTGTFCRDEGDPRVSRRKAFATSLSSGALLSFDPNFNSAFGVWAMEFDPVTGRLFAGGDFTDARGGAVDHLAMFETR
jgi:hypothetical protein